MKKINCMQRSPEWFSYKAGKVSGTRLGPAISNKKNKLIYEIVNEILDATIIPSDFITDDMQRGIDLEPVAIQKYEEVTGNKVELVGILQNEKIPISMHSPDGIVADEIIVEIKCPNPVNQIKTWIEGHDYHHQILNCFVVSEKIKEVHYFSFCPERPELPYFLVVYLRSDFENEIKQAEKKLIELQISAEDLVNKLTF